MLFLEALKKVKRRPNQIGFRPVVQPEASIDSDENFNWRTGCCYSITPKGVLCAVYCGTLRGRKADLVFGPPRLTVKKLLGEWEIVTEKELNEEYAKHWHFPSVNAVV